MWCCLALSGGHLSGTIVVRTIFVSKVFRDIARVVNESIEEELTMKNKIIEFLKDENGQTSTEYILLVAVVAVIIFKFREQLETKLTGLVDKVFGKSDELLNDL